MRNVLRGQRWGAAIAGALTVSLLAAAVAGAQTYPAAPVRVLVPFGAGGATDVVARVFMDRLQQRLGQSFTVENRGGAAGQIAATAFARAPADGYTLMFTTAAPITIAPLMNDKVQYDPAQGLRPGGARRRAAGLAGGERPVADQVAGRYRQRAKDEPGKLTYGTSGVGTELHLAAEAVARAAGIQMVHVPFRGGGEVITALLGSQIDFAALSTASIAGALKQGTLRAIAVSSAQRKADFPDVPTFAELGYAGATMEPWWGLMARAGTPQPVIASLAQEMKSASEDDAVRERLKALFVQIEYAGPGEFARRLEAETKLYGDVIRAAKIKLE